MNSEKRPQPDGGDRRVLESGSVKVFLAIGSNVLSSFPDTNRVRAALAKADLVVAYDIFPNQLIREAADIVLPGTIWLEEIGAKSTNTHIHLSDRVLPAAGEARPAYELYKGLASLLGVEDVYPWADQTAAMNAALDHPATGHATVDTLRANGGRVALKVSHIAHPTLAFATPSGKIEFYSERAKSLGLPPLPMPAVLDANRDGLTLAQGRTFAHFHSFYDHARALPTLAGRETDPDLWIAPEDAEDRDIADGEPIEISNARGTFTARAKVTRRIRHGNVHSADGSQGVLDPDIARYAKRDILRFFRADAAYAIPAIYARLEETGYFYAIRLPSNNVLREKIAHRLTRPVGRPSLTKVKRFFEDFEYRAQSWEDERRVIAKIEWHPGELFPRVGFIVTNLPMEPDWVMVFYNQRGTAEQHIKEGKYAFHWTRLSCRRFRDKEVRLQLHALAYNLATFLRCIELPKAMADWSLTSLQLKLIKIGARVVRHARAITFQLAEVAVTGPMVRAILAAIRRLRAPPLCA